MRARSIAGYRTTAFGAALLALVLVPGQARANIGVPMIAVAWPLSWCAFLPIVLVEAWIARRQVGLSWSRASLASLGANALSTLGGIPLTWGILTLAAIALTRGGRAYGVESVPKKILAVTVQAPWLVPYESQLYWMVPTALLVLLPFFALASVLIERVAFRRLAGCTAEQARTWSWRSNLTSYGIAAVAICVWLAVAVQWEHQRR